jgi:hypothetical protein
MDLNAAYRIFHPTIIQYTFFLAVHGTFSRRSILPNLMMPTGEETMPVC